MSSANNVARLNQAIKQVEDNAATTHSLIEE